MAIFKCPECGKEIMNTVDICPNCGYKIAKKAYGSINDTESKNASSAAPGQKGFNQTYLTVAIVCFVIFVVCWYYKASNGVSIASAELDYAAVRYVSTTMIMGRIASIAEPISIIAGIIFGIISFVKGAK